MFELILTICTVVTNAHGVEIADNVCEQAVVAQYRTLEQCTKGMDKNITATKRSVLASFDWAYSCERKD